MMGGRAADAARRAEESGADAVGANCAKGRSHPFSLTAMKDTTTCRLIAQSNAGISATGRRLPNQVWIVTSDQMQNTRVNSWHWARAWWRLLRTNPQFIAAIAKALKG